MKVTRLLASNPRELTQKDVEAIHRSVLQTLGGVSDNMLSGTKGVRFQPRRWPRELDVNLMTFTPDI